MLDLSNLSFKTLLISILLFACISCNLFIIKEKTKKEKILVDSTKNSQIESNIIKFNADSVFKCWLNDTLDDFIKWEKIKEINISKKSVSLNEDSTLLSAKAYYSEKVKKNQQDNLDSPILIPLNLLREFSEYPKVDFEISFGHLVDYWSSEVEQSRYSFSEEFISNEFIVLQKDKKIIYTILRGTLREKKIITFSDSTVTTVPIYLED